MPHLLRTGAICELTHLIVEWHLNAVAPEERLAALGQRLSLESMARTACPNHAMSITHAGYHGNNEGASVPGLTAEVSRHAGSADGEWGRAHGEKQRPGREQAYHREGSKQHGNHRRHGGTMPRERGNAHHLQPTGTPGSAPTSYSMRLASQYALQFLAALLVLVAGACALYYLSRCLLRGVTYGLASVADWLVA